MRANGLFRLLTSYRERMATGFPFHPELVDILTNRWGSLSGFQRTRGALRTLAHTVKALAQRHQKALLIHPGDVALADPGIRGEVIRFAGESFKAALNADIIRPDSIAPTEDKRRGGIVEANGLATGLATTSFLDSFGPDKVLGASAAQMLIGVGRPGLSRGVIEDVRDSLESSLWYMRLDGGRYRFTTEPNLNKVILERESAITDDRIETIIDAIAEGRAIWASVRDAIAVLVGGNLGEIAFTVGTGLLLRRGSPLNARQLLLVNLLTDMLPAMALAVQPGRVTPESLLREGPDVSLGQPLTRDILLRGGLTAGAGMGAWLGGRMTGITADRAGTIALVGIVGAQLGQTLLIGWRSPLVAAASLGSAAALATVTQTPGVSRLFGGRPLGPVGWGIGLGAAAAASVAAPLASRLLPQSLAGPGGAQVRRTDPSWDGRPGNPPKPVPGTITP